MSLPPPGKPAQRSGASAREKGRALLNKDNAAIDRAKATRAGTMWTRLNAVDFINSAFQFATYALLCIFPFMIVLTAAAGDSFRKVIIARLGLNPLSSLFFSKSIISDEKSYGPVAVVMVLVTYFIAIGVAVHLGAVFGRMWDERHTAADEKTSVTPE